RRHVERLRTPSGPPPAAPSTVDPEPMWDLGPGLVERTPTLADPALEAWCSFCCRPVREVGPLVAGPAQAFVCRAGVALAARLLGPAPAESPAGSTAVAATARPEASSPASTASLRIAPEPSPGAGSASPSALQAPANGARIASFVAVRPADAPV